MADFLQVAVSVGTPLSLLGLACALAYLAYARKLKSQEKKLEALPSDERAKLADDYLTRYGIDGSKLKAADKLALIRDELDKRHRRSMTFGLGAAVVFVVCFALCVVAYIAVMLQTPEDTTLRNPSPTQLVGPHWADLTQAPSYLRQNVRSIPAMQRVLPDFIALSESSAGQFFCSKPLLHDWTDPTLRLKGIPEDAASTTVAAYVFVQPGSNASDQKRHSSHAHGGVVTMELSGRVPKGSVVLVACWVPDPMSTALDAALFEAFLE
jgi:hypothetical protein